jgi:hypothetical protein
MKRLRFARQTDPSDRIPMPGLCRDFGRDWEGNEKDGGVECLDDDDPHWNRLLEEGALAPVPPPQGADRFAPFAQFIRPVRQAFEAFGLAKDDEELWDLVRRNVDLVARGYRYLRSAGAIPKPSEIRTQFKDVEKAARNFAAALDALSEPALDWMLAFDPPFALLPRSRAGGESPAKAPIDFRRLLEAALGTDLVAYEDILAKWASGPINEDQKQFQESLQDLANVASIEQNDAEIAKAKRKAQLLKTLGSMPPPAPYHIRDRLTGKARAIAALAKKARARAVENGPPNPSNKLDKKVFGRTPHDWLIECCLDLIERTFEAEGLRKVSAYRVDSARPAGASLFTELLRAVEEYATGEEPSSFSEAANQISELRDERLRRLGEPPVNKRPKKRAESTAACRQ